MINTFRNIFKPSGNTDHDRFDDNGNHQETGSEAPSF